MKKKVTLNLIVDREGQVLAAQLPAETKVDVDEKSPHAELSPMAGQQVVRAEVPKEVLRLRGPELQRYFSHMEVRWPAEVRLPKVELVQAHTK